MINAEIKILGGLTVMTIGIIAAMDEEIHFLREKINQKKETTIANTLFIEGELNNHSIVLMKSGIGKVNAAMSTTILHERYRPNWILNTGSAGGLAEELNIGDIIISTEVIHHDVDVTAFNYEFGQVPGMPPSFKADSSLVKKAKSTLENLEISSTLGLIGTGDSFMDDYERVSFIKEKFPALIAAEMEAAAIAQVCYQYQTPFVVIRALSDIAGKESDLSFEEFIYLAAENSTKFIIEMLKNMGK